MTKKIIIGTRGSDLALWQARFLQSELKNIGYDSELKIIKTQGDKIQNISLEKLEGKGFFTKEIEDVLLDHATDIAVHSHKDLPTQNTPGLIIAAVSGREDPAELILIRKEAVDELKEFHIKQNAVAGTSSSRRSVQLKFYRPDLHIKDIRGNVPTRIEKLRRGEFDAIILAAAGVNRLNLDCSDLHVIKVPVHQFIPAPAQGVLAYQCREDDTFIIDILKQIDHKDVAQTISVEREVMRLFQGGCHMPLGVYCEKINHVQSDPVDEFHIWAVQSGNRDSELKRLFIRTDQTNGVAESIFNSLQKTSDQTVFITTRADQDPLFLKILQSKELKVTCRSLVEFEPLKIDRIPACGWIFFTSKNAVKYFFDQVTSFDHPVQFAAIGSQTAKEINKRGYKVDFAGEGDTDQIAHEFLNIAGNSPVLLPQAFNANKNLANRLSQKLKVEILPVYKNIKLKDADVGHYDIIVFTSALNAEAYLSSNQLNSLQTIIAIGNSTKKYLNEKGIQNVFVPPYKNLLSVADLICGLV